MRFGTLVCKFWVLCADDERDMILADFYDFRGKRGLLGTKNAHERSKSG